MKTKIFTLAACIVLALGCAKEGPPGKDGINGTNGVDGLDGVEGAKGEKGDSGFVNVKSKTFDVELQQWKSRVPKEMYYQFFTGDVDDDAMNGTVLVYLINGNKTVPLPLTEYTGSAIVTYSYTYEKGMIEVSFKRNDAITPTLAGTVTYKYVTVKASELALHPEVDLTNYEEVRKTFHIKD